jgi:catechol 2,3-dioxygenase-like lactoylglutathione lyase family enzyme
MITGAHVLIWSKDANAVRDFLRDVLELPHSGDGDWLLFRLPPGELATHPTESSERHELYFMCDDINATVADLAEKGAEFDGEITDEGFGVQILVKLPDGGRLGVYEPRYTTAFSDE